MYQFYFLSIVLNLLAGIALAYDAIDEKFSLSVFFNRDIFNRQGFRLSLGIATSIVGFFKLLSVTAGNVPVVGDLLPALTGLILGGSLLALYYQERSTVSGPIIQSIDNIFLKNRTVFGILGIITAVLHFLFPSVLFL
ncbi:MAG TPA: hypothetical protein VMW73_07760 [Spirochaetia bacterium]|nr:hypothetical protein [Spirochaetia bacterium]